MLTESPPDNDHLRRPEHPSCSSIGSSFWSKQILSARQAVRVGHSDGLQVSVYTLLAAYRNTGVSDCLDEVLASSGSIYFEAILKSSRSVVISVLNLTTTLLEKYHLTGDIKYVQEAVKIHERIVDDSFTSDKHSCTTLRCFGEALIARYEHLGDVVDLRRGGQLLAQAKTQKDGNSDSWLLASFSSFQALLITSPLEYYIDELLASKSAIEAKLATPLAFECKIAVIRSCAVLCTAIYTATGDATVVCEPISSTEPLLQIIPKSNITRLRLLPVLCQLFVEKWQSDNSISSIL
jgi:hypothetical protein